MTLPVAHAARGWTFGCECCREGWLLFLRLNSLLSNLQWGSASVCSQPSSPRDVGKTWMDHVSCYGLKEVPNLPLMCWKQPQNPQADDVWRWGFRRGVGCGEVLRLEPPGCHTLLYKQRKRLEPGHCQSWHVLLAVCHSVIRQVLSMKSRRCWCSPGLPKPLTL